MQIGGGTCPCYLFRDCGPRSAQTEQSGETALVICPSQLSQIYRPHSAQIKQSHETPLIISLSHPPKESATPMPTSLPRKHRLVSVLLCRIYLHLRLAGRHIVRCPECRHRD